MAAYCRVYDSRHLQADCQEPGFVQMEFKGSIEKNFNWSKYWGGSLALRIWWQDYRRAWAGLSVEVYACGVHDAFVRWRASASRPYFVLIGCSETRTVSARSVLSTRGCPHWSSRAGVEFSSMYVTIKHAFEKYELTIIKRTKETMKICLNR